MQPQVYQLESWQKKYVPEAFGVTIGNFDGVHLGHTKLIQDFVKTCKDSNLTPVVFTFCPHPCLYFNPGSNHLLTSYRKKYDLLAQLGVAQIVEIHFNEKLQNMTGKEFANETLLSKEGIKLLWVGHDFTFGKNKEDPEWIDRLDREISFKKVSPFKFKNEIVSSSLIRSYLKQGNVEFANKLLGRDFYLEGKVVHGKKLGREIGFPTINIQLDYPFFIPALGVYKVRCRINSNNCEGVMNLGRNPSVDNGNSLKVEVHLFNFNEDVYGSNVEVYVERFIREERKFNSIDELKKQIALDLEAAKSNND